ncbi:N,N-dimethylformamidase beta subunit family domain-containing protein [Nitratireductor sp. XY-223]|uniref:N,N-dimethylformamidase beta subunit family domain-containing protein n=1 Tax=Nitratireductor sp. XY-223 TaxID=2561926 RepID=UPI0010A9B498|nr:N,N-dimethylformamidase beta subunit family domain-containing protein [Nitratireductor sp. XY-223]
MTNTRIFGYADPLNPKAGDAVDFMISVEGRHEVETKLVRLVHGDENPEGPGFIEEEIETDLPSWLNVKRQYTQVGSFARCDDPDRRLDGLQSFTVFAHICPTLPKAERQMIMGRWAIEGNRGYGLGIDPDGHVSLWIGDGESVDQITTEIPLVPRAWYFVAARFDGQSGEAELHVINCVNPWNSRISTVVPFEDDSWIKETLRVRPAATADDAVFHLAAATAWNRQRGTYASFLYNGKIDRSGVYDRVLSREEITALSGGAAPTADGLVAYWDPTVGITETGVDDRIVDTGPHGLDLAGVNRPVRLMTGFNWAGADSFRLAPETYGGVHFHDDALTDSGWEVSHSLRLPANLRSGVYALRLRAGGMEDHVPFFVRPQTPGAKIAVLMPTFTYLAYANEHLAYEAPIAQAIVAHTPVIVAEDLEYKKLEEFGLSTYDHHSDGAGCCYSSWRRPIISLRPRYRMPAMNFPWALPADLSLLWWLEHAGYDYDILTDHDLHAEGAGALAPYKVVLNGTHPEYYSEEMMDGTEDYLRGGGRVMYLGGNGYYWVTGLRAGEPHCIEVRKLDTGSRAWQAEPGEGHLACTGERSGLWRSRGRAPQKIVGLGFTTEGMDESQPYERMPDSFHKRVSWIMQGIGDEEPIGDFGLAAGGCAGVELDRYELGLGTPPHAMLLASSWGHSDNYPLVSEEITYAFPGRGGTQDAQVRGDMIYFTTPNDGAVFAAGSIAWSQALPCNGGDNNVAQIMRNLLDAFTKDGKLPGSQYTGDEKLWR